MSYRIHHTEGLIVGTWNNNEDSRLFRIFTPDLGVISVLGQGTRKISSKLRPHLQEWAQVQLSLVRGKEFWRVVGAERTALVTSILANSLTALAWVRVCVLVRRLVRGEGEQEELFRDVKAGAVLLASLQEPELVANFELIMTLRVLHQLGYVADNSLLAPILTSGEWSREIITLTPALQVIIKQEIARSLAASQL